MLVESERTLLESFRVEHPDAVFEHVDDLYCLRWEACEVRGLSFADMMARAWAAERPPASKRYPDTVQSPPPPVWIGLPDVEEGGLER